jgi:hypothetical protein
MWAILFPDCIRGAANDKWGRSIELPQPMTSGLVYFSGKDIYCRSMELPQPMTSGVVNLFTENNILPLCGASAGNDRWGRLFIYRKSYRSALWGRLSQ